MDFSFYKISDMHDIVCDVDKIINQRHDPSMKATKSLFSFLFDFFTRTTPPSPPPAARIAFMPLPTKADISTPPLTTPITILKDNTESFTRPPSLSSSSSSDSSSLSTTSFDSDEYLSVLEQHDSMAALSDILCDHYVQRHCQQEDVPLETFSVFESTSPPSADSLSWHSWEDLPKEWIRVNHFTEEEHVGDDDCDEPATKTDEEARISSNDSDAASEETEVFLSSREVRANAAHLRMIVAEINMMRADKIVCPLRPRAHLPRRTDSFVAGRPSPLRDQL
ncbi:hypothetical protein BX666DRAFT_1883818 [Dichotomocladium elegans]|nr:hypothetical protein BX666DRAFT_1883818 [Dichotomocladium elegans]